MANISRSPTSGHNRVYQGYPYINQTAFEVPSIDSHTASRWARLPRRPMGSPVKVNNSLPECSASQNVQISGSPTRATSRTPDTNSEDDPVVYIEMPEDRDTNNIERRNDERLQGRTMFDNKNEEDEPAVYIDFPESSCSAVSERREEVDEGPSFVQDTIFYDPFKDRRIDVSANQNESTASALNNDRTQDTTSDEPKDRRTDVSTDENVSANSENSYYSNSSTRRLIPPNTLNLQSTVHSGSVASAASTPRSRHVYTLTTSPHLNQDTGRFRHTPEDDFFLSPLPVNEFPEPPPAYSEMDPRTTVTTPPRQELPILQPLSPEVPTRTTVIINNTMTQNTNGDRKLMTCKHCGKLVQSLVVKHARVYTHIAASLFLVCGCFPLAVPIYCYDACKFKNHYCPNCNKLMTYEWPFKFCKK